MKHLKRINELFSKDDESIDLLIRDYNKVREIISSCKTLEQLTVARKSIVRFGEKWIDHKSKGGSIGPNLRFLRKSDLRNRIHELDDYLKQRLIEIAGTDRYEDWLKTLQGVKNPKDLNI